LERRTEPAIIAAYEGEGLQFIEWDSATLSDPANSHDGHGVIVERSNLDRLHHHLRSALPSTEHRPVVALNGIASDQQA
jgi:hypothetical protein